MAFKFKSGALIDSETLSKFIWGVDDAETDSEVALSSQEKFTVQLIVNAISQQIKMHVGYSLVSDKYVEVWDGGGSDELVPREWPIQKVRSIKFSGNSDFDNVDAQSSDSYNWTENSITLQNFKSPRGRSLIQVIYDAGYDEIPDDIIMATLLQFQWNWKQIGKGGSFVGVKSIGKMGETQTKDDDLNKFGLRSEVIGLLKNYVRFEAPLSIMYARVS